MVAHWFAPAAVFTLSNVLLCAGVTGLVGLLVDEGSEVASLVLFFLRNPRVGIKEVAGLRSNPMCAGLPGRTDTGRGGPKAMIVAGETATRQRQPDAGGSSRAIGKKLLLASTIQNRRVGSEGGGGISGGSLFEAATQTSKTLELGAGQEQRQHLVSPEEVLKKL